jgi:hypothetical protein
MKRVPDSVLWLVNENNESNANLLRQAEVRGIDRYIKKTKKNNESNANLLRQAEVRRIDRYVCMSYMCMPYMSYCVCLINNESNRNPLRQAEVRGIDRNILGFRV